MYAREQNHVHVKADFFHVRMFKMSMWSQPLPFDIIGNK